MEKFTKEWWKNLSDETEISHTISKINFILQFTGKWNRSARVLEIQCGLGSMPQFMFDHGYEGYMGIDNNEPVSGLWENTGILQVAEPDSTGFETNEFHLVCWFSMNDGRVEQERIPDVLEEMGRITQSGIILKPFATKERGKDSEFLAFMLDNGWICYDCNPVTWNYYFYKG